MKTNIFIFLNIIFLNFYSCQQKPSIINQENLNIVEIKPIKKIIPFKEKWAREKLPTKWIEVKKDSKGYLIYLPCDGSTRSFDFQKEIGVLEIVNQIESPTQIDYEYSTNIQNDNWFILEFGKNKKSLFSLKGAEYDKINQLVLFKFNDEKILVTPYENYDNFRKVENKCANEKVPELQFENIN